MNGFQDLAWRLGSFRGGDWTPASPIGGNLPVLWLKADGITGLNDGDAVASWPATTGGVNAVQATPTKQPSYQAGEWNGKPTVSFDGGDLLRIAGTVSVATSGTLFAVFSVDNRTGTVTVVSSNDEATASIWWLIRIASGQVVYLVRNGAVFNDVLTASGGAYAGMAGLYLASGTPHVIVVQSDGATVIVRIDGAQHILTVTGGANNGNWLGDVPNRDNFVLGALKNTSEAQFLTGDEGSILLYDAILLPTQIQQVENFYNKFYGISQIVFDGNSMTKGTGGTAGNDYPLVCTDALAGNYVHQNFGMAGQTTANMITNAARVDALFSPSRPKNVLVAWEGTNDLFFGATAEDAYARLVSYCQARQVVGWKVIILTVLPRSNVGTPAGFEAARQTLNTSIRANWATFANALADVAANTDIGEAGDELNATYYTDKVHMTNAGYAIVAGIVATAIATL